VGGGGGVPCAVLHFSRLSTEVEVAFRSNDSAGVSEQGFVNNQGETARDDVREGCDRCVGPTVCFASPNSNGHHTTSDITSRVRSETDGGETPDDHRVAKTDNHRQERGGDEEIGVIDASPDDHSKDESTDEFVEEDVSKRCTGGSIQRKTTGNACGREVDCVKYAFSFEGCGEGLDLVVVLDVDDKARDETSQDLGNDVSECLQGRKPLEEGSCNGDTRTEMSPRHRSADRNGEDDSYGIRKANTE